MANSLDLFSLNGKRAMVTGGSRGLGKAIAGGLAGAGARVAIVARNQDELDAAARDIGDDTVTLVADMKSVNFDSLVSQAETELQGAIDVVVHVAGMQHRETAEEFDYESWQSVLKVNLHAPFLLSQAIGKRQLASGSKGSHIFIGSLTSTLSLPNMVAYTASKAGVIGVMKSLSTEWSARGIRANAISPGYFKTKLTEAVFNDDVRSAQLMERIPTKRFGEPGDIVGAAIFLASEASSYVTGQTISVDGGWTSS